MIEWDECCKQCDDYGCVGKRAGKWVREHYCKDPNCTCHRLAALRKELKGARNDSDESS